MSRPPAPASTGSPSAQSTESAAASPRTSVAVCGRVPRGVRRRDLESLARRTFDCLVERDVRPDRPFTLSIRFAGDDTVRSYNRDYRGIDHATDVLSFPLGDVVDGVEHLGDLLLSRDRVRSQAEGSRWSERRETEELILHGILHLVGYDHETDQGEMASLELELRDELLAEGERAVIQQDALVALAIAPLTVVFVILSLFKTTLRSLTRVSVRRLADTAAVRHRRCLNRYLDRPSEFILRVQSVVQASLVAIAALVTYAFMLAGATWPLSVAVATLIACIVVLEHLFPRIVQGADPHALLLRLLPAFELLEPVVVVLAKPLIYVLNAVLPAPDDDDDESEVSDEDVRAFIDVGEQEGILGEEQGDILESLVDFGETVVREVMTPRVDMVSIEARRTIAEARDLIIATKHSRVPVYRERVDNVEGIADIRVLLEAWRAGRDADPVAKWLRPTQFVPETKKVSSLLKDFQRDRVTLAVVVDEYGGISGLVTVEDLVEEIVGEITEEHEEDLTSVMREADGSYLFSAKVDLQTLEETVGLALEEGAYDTLAGYVFATLGRVPVVGEEFVTGGLRFTVVDADRRRVNKVRVSPAVADGPEGPTASPSTPEASA